MNKVKVETNGRLEMYTVDDFLTEEECDYVVKYIDDHNYRSSVTANNDSGATVSEYRTSYSSTLNESDPQLKALNEKIHDFMAIPVHMGEGIQGQRYEAGQYFNDHTDYFDGPEAEKHIGNQGQRNWTCMIYLSDVEEGGETDFPRLGLKFKPKKRQAVIWNSLYPDERENPDSLHAGRPPVKGTKYIITKWFRNGIPFSQKNGLPKDVEPTVSEPKVLTIKEKPLESGDYVGVYEEPPLVDGVRQFSKREHMPIFTEEGFKVVDVPKKEWGMIMDIYKLLQPKEAPEKNLGNFIVSDKHETAANILNMDFVPSLKNDLHKKIQPIMEEWSGYELEPATCYGIRSYLEGATLGQHLDRLTELHVSGIILVDQDVDEPWGLDIIDHKGRWHNVVIEPGQMILYESSRLSHGRDVPLKGRFFRNFFIHYKLKGWEYVS